MKSIIDYVKEGLSPAELADMIEDGVYEIDDFGRLKNDPINMYAEDRQHDLDSLLTLVREAKRLELPLAELINRIESRKVSDLDLGIAVLRNGVPVHWLDAVKVLQSIYRKDGDHKKLPLNENAQTKNMIATLGDLRIGWHQELAEIMCSMRPIPKQNRPIREAIKNSIENDTVFRDINLASGAFVWVTSDGESKDQSGATLDNLIANFRKALKS